VPVIVFLSSEGCPTHYKSLQLVSKAGSSKSQKGTEAVAQICCSRRRHASAKRHRLQDGDGKITELEKRFPWQFCLPAAKNATGDFKP